MSIKNKIYNLIREDDVNDIYSNIFDLSIISLIVINLLLIILDTFNMPDWYFSLSSKIESISVIIFTLEYLARLWVSDLAIKWVSPTKARVKHVFSFMAMIDLLAILPFYIPFLIPVDLRILRSLRMIRLMRLLKINRYTSALKTITTVFINKKNQLASSLIIVSLLMIISSVIMYNLESQVQPDVFENAFSGLWWAVATLTTVGYGDIYPITFGGKVMAGIIALLGIGLVAVPTGIISAGFVEMIDVEKLSIPKKHRIAYIKRKNRRPK
ncbi:MAG: Ion transporter [Firmicutes bacterium HGW-Firmicutes-19]|nr:MAG: Ion transporter [Firmicutes bacterium HGW-Firmicutes-19]